MKLPAVSARQLRNFNLWATLVWLGLVVPTVFWWGQSVMWVALMSVWANVASHFSAWVAGRAEVAAEEGQ